MYIGTHVCKGIYVILSDRHEKDDKNSKKGSDLSFIVKSTPLAYKRLHTSSLCLTVEHFLEALLTYAV